MPDDSTGTSPAHPTELYLERYLTTPLGEALYGFLFSLHTDTEERNPYFFSALGDRATL